MMKYAYSVAIALPLITGTSLAAAEARDSHQVGTAYTEKELVDAVAPMRAGAKLLPKVWPHGAKVAVCLSWDVDNESFTLAAGDHSPIMLSWGEFGAKEGLERIFDLLDRHAIPASFFVPAVSAIVAPGMIEQFKRRPQHEVAIHGWIHENVATINDREEEKRLLLKAVSFWEQALGKRPVGYRAPYLIFSQYTLELLRETGFKYDSSAMSMSVPYEINSFDQPTGLVEVPLSWVADDAPYLYLPGGALPSPELVFDIYRQEFDVAYQEGTLFVLTLHPMISGRRAHMAHLDKMIGYMKSKPGVWFATAQQIAEYVSPHATNLHRE